MEIMFDDLTPEAQEKLLDEACVSRPEDMYWDEVPVAVVEFIDDDYIDDDDIDDDVTDDVVIDDDVIDSGGFNDDMYDYDYG